jgi:DUF4097 and DUF4098 domain-containing protein YvlB
MSRRFAGALVALALAGSAAAAHAGEWQRTFAVTGRADVRVVTNDGHITVRGTDRRDIAVNVTTVGWNLERDIAVDAHQVGGTVEVSVKIRPRFFMFDWGQRRLRIDVEMPRNADLEARSSDGGLDVENLSGRVALTTSDGSIAARSLKGEARFSSSDGAILGEELDGTLVANSSDGSIRVSGRFDHLALGTSDGRIVARAANGSAIGEGWNLRTSDGSVTLSLPDGFKADLDASAGDGSISVDFPVLVSGRWGRHRLQGSMNGGGGLLTVHTGDGSIRLGKI